MMLKFHTMWCVLAYMKLRDIDTKQYVITFLLMSPIKGGCLSYADQHYLDSQVILTLEDIMKALDTIDGAESATKLKEKE